MNSFKFLRPFILFISIVLMNEQFFSQESNNSINESIAIIHKNNGETIRGIVHNNDSEKITIISGNDQKITIPYSQIVSIEFINTKNLKTQSEFEEDHLNYTNNCFLPTAFTTKKGDFTGNVHYGLSGNGKIGITDNFEITGGTIGFVAYYFSLGYSKEIGKVIQFGVNGYGGFTYDFGYNEINPSFCLIPRISLGNKDRNVTMGLIGATGQQRNGYIGINNSYESLFGGYIGIKHRFKERWVVSTELGSINSDNTNLLYMGNLTFNFMRNFHSSWSLGVVAIWQEDPNGIQYLFNQSFLPLPYFGYMRKFN